MAEIWLFTLHELVSAREVGFDSVEALARHLGDEVVEDAIGRKCVTTETARQLIEDHRAAVERGKARRAEWLAKLPKPQPPRGIPADDISKTPFEVFSAQPGYVTVAEEFQGRPKPNFIEDELSAGAETARQLREKAKAARDARKAR